VLLDYVRPCRTSSQSDEPNVISVCVEVRALFQEKTFFFDVENEQVHREMNLQT
jgi:hypothetical protein